jgi:DNA-binding NtrC family response regulator
MKEPAIEPMNRETSRRLPRPDGTCVVSDMIVGAVGAPRPLESEDGQGAEGGFAHTPLVGLSAVMMKLKATLDRIAGTASTVLIEGETGTGKEVCARAIHQMSSRADQPFAVCDLAGIPRTLVESELFGHVRGAFTGATTDRVGAFESAGTGTLLLDEIGDLESEAQPRLLRALEGRNVRPVGTARYRKIEARIIAATNRDLARDVEEGRFRRDLYHRLAVLRIRMPPLREHMDDIPLLASSFLAGTGVGLAPEAMSTLHQYDWPGNIRELRNAIERGAALAGPGGLISSQDLGLDPGNAPERHDGVRGEEGFGGYHSARRMVLESFERSYAEGLLARTRGNVAQAARLAGVGRSYLHRMIRKHDLRGERVAGHS